MAIHYIHGELDAQIPLEVARTCAARAAACHRRREVNSSAGRPIVPPGDPRFGTVIRGFNQRWIADPAYVRLCSSPADVVTAVESAVGDGLRITVRSGGHCYENFAYGNSGGVVVDLSLMNGVYVDAETGWLVIDAGATLFDVYSQLYKQYGVTLPGGSCYSVGAGGHITGGGYGLLSCLHGLTVDYLSAVEVVHVDGSGQVRCDRFSAEATGSAESLMLWGNQGGGGGNFGIVTKFFFADPPAAPSQVCLVSESWNWADFTIGKFTEFLQTYGQFFVDHKEPGDPFQSLFALLYLSSNTRYSGDALAVCNPDPQRLRESSAR